MKEIAAARSTDLNIKDSLVIVFSCGQQEQRSNRRRFHNFQFESLLEEARRIVVDVDDDDGDFDDLEVLQWLDDNVEG